VALLPAAPVFTDFSRWTRAILGPLWFGWTSFAILYSALVVLVLLAWIPFRQRTPFAQFARWPSRLFLWIVIVGSLVGWYQALVPLRVERVVIPVDALPPSLEGTRIALVGDLHVGLFTRPSRLEQIFATTAAEKPAVVLIAGDMIDDDPHFIPKLLGGAGTLPDSIPLLGVFGNHEMYGRPAGVVETLRGSRLRLLVNEGFAIGDLWIAGLSDPAAREMQAPPQFLPDLDKALAGKRSGSVSVLLVHQPKPETVDGARRRNVPLMVSAHTHGGQLGFRPLGISLAGLFLRYHMGHYDLSPTQLYINTGTGYWLLPFRLGMTPEITILELRRS
jgi:predicted MPP superfamily phosphohydrolase